MSEVAEKKWVFRTASDEGLVQELSTSLNILPVMADLLIQRGVTSFEQARTFFRPSLEMLHDPFLMKDMDKAVARVLKSIENKEKIMVLGDYDVDGTTAAALAFKYLRKIGAEVSFYIPDRYSEGYGISIESIDVAADKGVGLVISLDCGIKAVDKVAYAAKKHIDFIICDHHTPGEKLPAAVAVLDPKRKDCQYPYDSLSGCGVGFKLMQALGKRLNLPDEMALESLDLLATSIAADIVPLNGENRILARFGLDKINKNPSPGILAMKELAGNNKVYTISDVVFKIAPRINSAGRMASGERAVEILISDNKQDAVKRVKEINQFNDDRRIADKDITKHAYKLISEDERFSERRTTVLFDPDWHKGVIGIVASRMIERHYRPTIIFTGSEGILSGSARSVKNFDLYSALEACGELLIQFGGHKYAAGMTLKEENFEKFRDLFDEVVSGMIEEEHLQPSVEIDASLALNDINDSFFKILKQFAPFGPDNMNPVFHSEAVIVREIRILTDRNDNRHLKLNVFHPSNEKKSFDAIGFGLGHMGEEIDEGSVIDIVYNIEENEWNNRTNLQLNLKDVRLS